jgi:hypothetical protein
LYIFLVSKFAKAPFNSQFVTETRTRYSATSRRCLHLLKEIVTIIMRVSLAYSFMALCTQHLPDVYAQSYPVGPGPDYGVEDSSNSTVQNDLSNSTVQNYTGLDLPNSTYGPPPLPPTSPCDTCSVETPPRPNAATIAADMQASVAQYTNDYRNGLLGIDCQGDTVCQESILEQLDNLDGFSQVAQQSLNIMGELACLQTLTGPPITLSCLVDTDQVSRVRMLQENGLDIADTRGTFMQILSI